MVSSGGEIVAAKVYASEAEEYYSFITSEAFHSLSRPTPPYRTHHACQYLMVNRQPYLMVNRQPYLMVNRQPYLMVNRQPYLMVNRQPSITVNHNANIA
jgi:hypothetical protein